MIFRFGTFELDPGARELRRGGAAFPLQPKVFDLLLHLVRNRHRTVGRDELLRVVWPGVRVTPASVSRALKSARRALGDDGARQTLLRTVPGAGVRFVAEVHPGEGGATADAARAALASGYVGRSEILAALRARLARATAGQGGVVLLAGEAGIGKTRTASEVLAWAAAEGARTLVASASAADGTPAFWLWRACLARLPDAERDEAERPGESAESTRLRLFEILRGALAGAAERAPLAILLDDLHEADEASIALLDALVPDLAARPILALGTLRPTEAASPPLARALERLARRPGVERTEIGPLSPGEVAELAARCRGAPLTEAEAARLAELTTGNPLWVEEGLRGAPCRSAGVALDWHRLLESSLERAIGARLGELPGPMRRWLAAAAVLGVAFDPGLASRVAEMSPRAGVRALGAARARRLLLEEEGVVARTVRFTNPLFRQVLYERLAPLERGALHARAAEALEQLGESAPLEEIAHHHLAAGGAADAAHAAGWGARAGARAEHAGAFDRAADLYDRALRRLGRAPADPKTACELAIALARVRRRLGDDAAAEPAARAMGWARAHGWPRAFAEAALAFAGSMDGYHLPRAELVQVLREALARVGPDDRDLRARLLARLASEESFAPGSRRDELGREALSLARYLGDAALEVEIAETPFAAISENLSLEELLALAERLQRQGEETRSDVVVLQARLLRLHALLASAEIESFDAEHARAEAQARALRDPVALYRLQLWTAARALLAGEPDRSERIALAAFARVGHGQFEGAAGFLGAQLVLAGAEQGRLPGAMPLLERDAELRVGPASRCFLAWGYAEADDAEGCRRALARAVETDLPTLSRYTWFQSNACLLARAAWFVGDAAPAAALEVLLAPARGRVAVRGGIAAHGPVSHALALLASLRGDAAAAAALFDEAEALARRMGAPLWVSRIEKDRARSAARTA